MHGQPQGEDFRRNCLGALMDAPGVKVPSREAIEDMRNSSLRYQERICALLAPPFRPNDGYTKYLTEIYAVAGHLIAVVDAYTYGIEEEDEVYLSTEDMIPILSFSKALASGVRLLRLYYNISLVEQ